MKLLSFLWNQTLDRNKYQKYHIWLKKVFLFGPVFWSSLSLLVHPHSSSLTKYGLPVHAHCRCGCSTICSGINMAKAHATGTWRCGPQGTLTPPPRYANATQPPWSRKNPRTQTPTEVQAPPTNRPNVEGAEVGRTEGRTTVQEKKRR